MHLFVNRNSKSILFLVPVLHHIQVRRRLESDRRSNLFSHGPPDRYYLRCGEGFRTATFLARAVRIAVAVFTKLEGFYTK